MKSYLRNQVASVFSSVCNRALLPLLIGILCIGSVQGQTFTIGGFFMQGVTWNPITRTYTANSPAANLPPSTLTQQLANGPVTIDGGGVPIIVNNDIVTTATNNLTIKAASDVGLGANGNSGFGKIEIGGALTIEANIVTITANISGSSVGVYSRFGITTGMTLQRIIGASGNGTMKWSTTVGQN